MSTQQPDRGVTLLLVDDEEEVRSMVSEYLRDEGYNVVEASNAKEAKQVIASRQLSVRLVVTDYRMPGESGVQLAQYVHQHYPGVPVLIVSGHASKDEVGDQLFLSKPFRLGVLGNVIGNILTEQRQS